MRNTLKILSLASFGAVALLALDSAPASAKTCKEPLSVTSRSTIKGTEEARTKRATNNAEKKWSKDVRAKYGVAYYFWSRADDKKIECRQTPKSAICVATATACRLI